jgi:hypothetical protein
LIREFFSKHKGFLYQVTALSSLLIILIIGGSYTKNNVPESKPLPSRTDSIVERFREEERYLYSDSLFFQNYAYDGFDLPEITVNYEPSTELTSPGISSREQLAAFLMSRNPRLDKHFVGRVVDAYVADCSLEGINHDVAFSQMCLETGYLRSKGQIRAGLFNFCGLGITKNGEIGVCFTTIEDGIRAHIQHLKAYASKEPLVTQLIDTRFGLVKRGSADDIHDLTGTWAEDRQYGQKMEFILMQLLHNDLVAKIDRKGS